MSFLNRSRKRKNNMEFICNICPRKCGALRREREGGGMCGVGSMPRLARAALHFWEEPCISGSRGSGTVFFSGCGLKCAYCQNYSVSAENFGKYVSEDRLYDIFLELIDEGAHNINLVNPTHYAHTLIRVLDRPLSVPVVWNTGGYDSVSTLRALNGKVSIYLTDLKYMDGGVSEKYSQARDYPEIAVSALDEMFAQRGRYVLDDAGIMQSGIIVRHLVLPENLDNTRCVINYIADRFSEGDILFSLMSQYTPSGDISHCPELRRRLDRSEYEAAYKMLEQSGICDGFFQEPSSADEEYIPEFDLTGV